MSHDVIRRTEMLGATLDLGGLPIDLSDYATTGLLAGAVGPRGCCKTNAGLLVAEQLSEQGWVAVLVDPEHELATLYGNEVADADELRQRLTARQDKILVVSASDAGAFVPYGRAILDVADEQRKPVIVVIDEGQLFSTSKRRQGDIGEASAIVNDFAGRGRKRALDLFVTALRYTGTLDRGIFSSMNLTMIGRQEDSTSWAALAPQMRASKLEFSDLHALMPGEFILLSRRGAEKVRTPMSKALERVALKAKPARQQLPSNFTQWDRAMRAIPTERLKALTPAVVNLMGAVAGLGTQQMLAGTNALHDELGARP